MSNNPFSHYTDRGEWSNTSDRGFRQHVLQIKQTLVIAPEIRFCFDCLSSLLLPDLHLMCSWMPAVIPFHFSRRGSTRRDKYFDRCLYTRRGTFMKHFWKWKLYLSVSHSFTQEQIVSLSRLKQQGMHCIFSTECLRASSHMALCMFSLCNLLTSL